METGNIIVYIPPTIFSIVSAAFFLLWHLKVIAAWQWGAGFAQTAIGFVLSSFSIQPQFDAFSSGLVFIGAAYCYGSGLLAHFDAPPVRRQRLVFVAAYSATLVYAVFVEQSLVFQLFLTDAGFAILLGFAVCLVARKATRPVDIALVVASVVVVLDSVVRTGYFTFFADSSDDLADFAHSAYNLSVHVSTITVCMIFPFTALGAIASAAVERHRAASERDPLTGLLNRRGFEQATARATSGSFMVLDIDHFKRINDSYGHALGDNVIVSLAQELNDAVGNSGYVARHGGEEFVAYLPGMSASDTMLLANIVRRNFYSLDWAVIGIPTGTSVSVGVSEVVNEVRGLDHAMLRADDALYQAKSGGRNRVVMDQSCQNLLAKLPKAATTKSLGEQRH